MSFIKRQCLFLSVRGTSYFTLSAHDIGVLTQNSCSLENKDSDLTEVQLRARFMWAGPSIQQIAHHHITMKGAASRDITGQQKYVDLGETPHPPCQSTPSTANSSSVICRLDFNLRKALHICVRKGGRKTLVEDAQNKVSQTRHFKPLTMTLRPCTKLATHPGGSFLSLLV